MEGNFLKKLRESLSEKGDDDPNYKKESYDKSKYNKARKKRAEARIRKKKRP